MRLPDNFMAVNVEDCFRRCLMMGHVDLPRFIVVHVDSVCIVVVFLLHLNKGVVAAFHHLLQDILYAGVALDPLNIDAIINKNNKLFAIFCF